MVRNMLLALPLACLVSPAAHAEWHEASSKHFVVLADDTPDNLRAFTQDLERFDQAIRVLRGAPDDRRGPASRVNIFVVDDAGNVQKLSGRTGIAGFYSARASGSVAFTPRRNSSNSELSPRAILFHEYAHHWMLTNWADAALPPWFVEGFAEFHATALMRGDGSVIFGAVPSYRRHTVADMSLLPVPQLVRPDPGKLSDPQVRDALYSRGWLLTHYLTFDTERRKGLAAYIGAINSRQSLATATAALGDVSGLDIKLNSYLKRPTLPSIQIRPEQLAIGEVAIRKLTAGEAAVMPARLASTAGVNARTAPVVYALAKRLAAAYPNDAAAQNELAEAAFDAKDYAGAEAAADRALAADPKSIHALIYKGKAQSEIAAAAGVSDAGRWTAIRRWFVAANKVDPEDPYPLVEYHESFRLAKQKPTKNAEDGLIYAYALAPFDRRLRIDAAYALLTQDRGPEARRALGPIAFDIAEQAQLAALAQRIIDAIDKDGAAAALKLIDEERKKAAGADKAAKKDG